MDSVIDLRRKVLQASLECIEKEGLSSLSMREVARMAGVSHQAPYHHFGDREGIFAAIAAEGFQQLQEEILSAISKGADPIQRLQAAGEAYVRFALGSPGHFKVMFRSELAPRENHRGARECADSCFDLVVTAANEAALDRWGREDEALPIAAWALVHGLATLLLEDNLAHRFGHGRKAEDAAISAVLKSFSDLLR